jgi:DNA-binding NarL/FixJ family response regulator
VVEDFVPFRTFICSKLEENCDLQVICQVSDGLEAVREAEELKPDLTLLDIGLPTLNGIAVARQIRKLAPDAAIIFVSQESSADVIQAAFGSGAQGYVSKTRAGMDLLPAVKAVLEGRQFVSCGLQITRGSGLSGDDVVSDGVLD